ncbi:MAG: hypothetical protein ACMXYE_03200 [Candidatus Woesearchaeota archaeon]
MSLIQGIFPGREGDIGKVVSEINKAIARNMAPPAEEGALQDELRKAWAMHPDEGVDYVSNLNGKFPGHESVISGNLRALQDYHANTDPGYRT